jgi:hypothetical protein
MTEFKSITRRSVVALMAFASLGVLSSARSQTAPGAAVKVYKEATCGCCAIWARHMAAAGFSVEIIDVPDVNRIKTQLGVPDRLATCHTAEVGGYLVEGHVPAVVVKRLLAEKPLGRGVAVPGMPVGSPGMEGGAPQSYAVFLFGAPGEISVFARCRGEQEL